MAVEATATGGEGNAKLAIDSAPPRLGVGGAAKPLYEGPTGAMNQALVDLGTRAMSLGAQRVQMKRWQQ